MILELRDTGRRFNRTWIFRHLNLTLKSPATLAVLGHNGSGKSTLLQLMAGFLSPSEGELLLSEQGRKIDSSQLFKYVSFSGPGIELIEEFTLEELLMFQLALKGSFRKLSRVELLERSGLGGTPGQIRFYSSGMKQRLKLLLAFSANVPVLLLDEPLTNLDAQSIQWYKYMLEFYAQDRIVVVASNDPQEYEFCQDHIHITDYK